MDAMLRTSLPKLPEIQRPIRHELDRVVAELRRIVFSDFPAIEEVNEHLFWARGKLFRPTLLLLCNQLGTRPHPQAVTLAAIVELVHLSTLVHDDAVDHSVLRRGMPTVNALWNHQTAVIMGDYLYSRAVTALAQHGSIELVEVLARAANDMSVGELRQLRSCDALQFSENDYDRLIASKTASLMSAACELGAAAGASEHRSALARYGHALGMAFQIADDLLDYTASEAVLGKPVGQDLREHKVTLPLIFALRTMPGVAAAEVRAFFADPEPSDEGVAGVMAHVEEHGGLDYARGRAEAFGETAALALSDLPVTPAREALHAAIGYVIGRQL
jgi:octaprenyl-diphosphate synthase